MGVAYSNFSGSSSDDATLGLPPSSDTPIATIGTSSYFTPAAANLLTHDHPHRASDCAIVEEVLLAHLPPDIVQRILDFAEIWASCRRGNRRNICVQAGGDEPHGKRGEKWRTGQEEEVAAAGIKLVDRPGEVWYLVSRGLGCTACEEVPAESDEDALNAANWADGHLDGAMRDLQVVEEDEEEEEEEVRRRRRRMSGRRLSYVGSKRWWARRIVVETFSRDQGWVAETSQQFYGMSDAVTPTEGTYENSFSWFDLGIVRDGKDLGLRYRIQNNVVAGAYYKPHTIVLGREHELLQELQAGDRVVLWLRAESPGWMNRCRRAAITIYAAPFAPQ